MTALIGFVILYMIISIAIGLYAARRVHSSSDYVVAGRSLPLYITTATVFATWFGSETVLGIPPTFVEEGAIGLIADPLGFSVCLILVGLFFARKLYRMHMLTIGDFYRRRYGRTVEIFVSLAICISYLGWVAAQIAALGLAFNVLTEGGLSREAGMALGLGIVVIYTLYGGMWSVALTDFVQMIVIGIGLAFVCIMISGMVDGGPAAVVAHAIENGRFDGPSVFDLATILAFIATFLTAALGAIPQQDVFQRVMSAKDEKTAMNGSILGGTIYFFFAFVPLFIGYAATLIDPAMTEAQMGPGGDTQLIMPSFILSHMPLVAQIMFFGALLSAIMSTASAALLAPSALFAENILKPLMPKTDDRHFLRLMRGTVLAFAILVLGYAYLQHISGATIFEMVENAYMVTLVGAFVPLAAGLYWKRANLAGATFSIILGVGTWVALEAIGMNMGEDSVDMIIPPQLAGLIMAIIGMVLGGYFGKQDHRHDHHAHGQAHDHAHHAH